MISHRLQEHESLTNPHVCPRPQSGRTERSLQHLREETPARLDLYLRPLVGSSLSPQSCETRLESVRSWARSKGPRPTWRGYRKPVVLRKTPEVHVADSRPAAPARPTSSAQHKPASSVSRNFRFVEKIVGSCAVPPDLCGRESSIARGPAQSCQSLVLCNGHRRCDSNLKPANGLFLASSTRSRVPYWAWKARR